jgi:hypothetical protein
MFTRSGSLGRKAGAVFGFAMHVPLEFTQDESGSLSFGISRGKIESEIESRVGHG